MKKCGGFTTIELILAVAILLILSAIVASSYETIKSRVRASEARANMDTIAQAGYTDFSYNGDWDDSPLVPDDIPVRIAAEGLLSRWPTGPCPGWYYTWDSVGQFSNAPATYVRVTLRRNDDWPIWSYCVSTFGGSSCQAIDAFTAASPIEISLTNVRHLNCDE